MILEIIIAVLLAIISTSLTAYQIEKEKKSKKHEFPKLGSGLLFIIIAYFLYCIWSLGFKNGIIIILIYLATTTFSIYIFKKFWGLHKEPTKFRKK
jgi:hypothetical protein